MADDKKHDDDKRDDRKDEKKKAEQDLPPTPTQAEADEAKVRLAGPNAKVDKREIEEPEIITPTPTQAENDAAKIVAMGGTDPAAPIDQANQIDHREKRAVEADKAPGYTTRSRKPD